MVEETTVDPTGEVGLLEGRVDEPGAIVGDGGNEGAVVAGPDVGAPMVAVVTPAAVVPVAVVATVVRFVEPAAVVAVPEVAADVADEVVGPDDAVVG